MARRRRAIRRQIEPDPKFESVNVALLINKVMRCGKKTLAQRIVYKAIDLINEKNKDGDPLEIVNRAIENVKPRVEVKSRRIGGATYQVPVEVAPERQLSLAMRWIVSFADKRKGVPMYEALASELLDAAAGQGSAIKKRDDVHKMAQANRAFAHLRFK
ncbi:MAG: 30S ribosomal protein S7 [Methylacidiphilales bacterium]|nr:30S ribosomal protein S7 [Candidatus Methylacidiphilales bacterium]MDW8348992.1 30S ribosomal protein S7 [Verrucomicrobiae bacterium]